MAEDNGLTRAPVLVVDLDTVFGGERAHIVVSSGRPKLFHDEL
jgi:hypothetical protein